MTTDTPIQALPLGIAALPEGKIACARCGTPTDGPGTPYRVLSRQVALPRGLTRTEAMPDGASVRLGDCSECAAVTSAAAAIVADNPWMASHIGSPAQHQVACALDALRVIGAPMPVGIRDDVAWDLLRLTTLGSAARWASRFAPVTEAGAREDRAASEPWLFVGLELRAEIQHAYVAWLARRRPPRPVPCPSGGCMLCGVASVLARHGDKPWRATSANASVLGGGGGSIAGHLCPTCQTAQDEAGSHMLDAAVLAVADPDRAFRRKRPEPPRLDGLVAWALLSEAPNDEPFQHHDIDGLRAALRRGW